MNQPENPEDMPPVPPGLKRLAGILLALFVIGMFAMIGGPTVMQAWREHKLLEEGTDATATILTMQDTGDRFNENPVVRFEVSVEVEGRAPWEAEIITPISVVEIQNYRVGAKVHVRYDPAKPQLVALVGPLGDKP